MTDDSFFRKSFRALTEHEPFPWQSDFHQLLVEGSPPSSCTLPTGLGKTSVIPIWLIALAENSRDVPRRLVYIVNRRTVVDQATDEAKKLRDRLATDEGRELRERLAGLWVGAGQNPLAISTLRGQFADNREWSADPSRPAIILGTVDMIGSRLLFSGYGIGFKSKPLHAGFLGQDVFVVHDEAHLEPAFQDLLNAISKEQGRCGDFRPFKVMELSATTRGEGNLALSDRDRDHPEIMRRIRAKKAIHLHVIAEKEKSDQGNKLVDLLADCAIEHKDSNRSVIIFARAVETVQKVADTLRKKTRSPVETLTGTIRGKERDELVNTPVFRRFLPGSPPGEATVYLVCTSAGEVGVNISADDMVCDLSTFESMAQRLGRVNRFGIREDTRVDVVHLKEYDATDDHESRLLKTLDLIVKLDGNGSPAALGDLDRDDRLAAFSPQPITLPATDILFDAWALTTVKDKMPGRPPVEPYLHGVVDKEQPETRVAWREEVGIVEGSLLELYKPAELLEDYPLKPHELLKDRSDRVYKRLVSLAKGSPDKPVWVLDDDGTPPRVLTLGALADKENKDQINNRTVILPPEVGGLKNGMLTGDLDDSADDVADSWFDEEGRQRRVRVWTTSFQRDDDVPDGMRLIRTIDTKPDDEENAESEDEGSSQRLWVWCVRPRSADDVGSRTSCDAVEWSVHTGDVTLGARRIVERLPLPEGVETAVTVAAKGHDLGKRRVVWQRAIGNPNPTNWLAKSGRKLKPIELTDYRHEFGSLLDVRDDPEFQALGADQQDLVLHLIAAHHGYGRPHFPASIAFDPEPRGKNAEEAAIEVPRRFARLQRKYGRWGLAYLESLLRAADYAASASPSATMEVGS